jgi:hypothetical protein
MTSLNSEIIGKYAKSRKQIQTDHSDFSYDYTFENGMILSSLYISEGKPIEQDSLEGYDGWIYIDTEEELIELLKFSDDDIEQAPEKIIKRVDEKIKAIKLNS